jgi:hypothetical protein
LVTLLGANPGPYSYYGSPTSFLTHSGAVRSARIELIASFLSHVTPLTHTAIYVLCRRVASLNEVFPLGDLRAGEILRGSS